MPVKIVDKYCPLLKRTQLTARSGYGRLTLAMMVGGST